MKTTVTIEIDLLQARPFRIDGAVYVTFPANGPLEAVTVCFSQVTKQSLRLTLDARERNARKIEEGDKQAVEALLNRFEERRENPEEDERFSNGR